MTYSISYYSKAVQTTILDLPPSILADYLRLSDLLQMVGPAIRMPHSRAMGDGLFELRPHGKEGIGRVLYCFQVGRQFVILHSFVKTTQEAPRKELNIAIQRMQEIKKC
ncbi:MAG: type II toxin-antitoxin system RelE/ParE family toxin [Aquirhabdus sp.]